MSVPEAVVLRQVDSYNARDLEGFLSAYHMDAVIERSATGEVVARGREQMRPRYAKLFSGNPGIRCEVAGMVVQGDFVVLSENISGLSDGGRRDGLLVYQVKDGLIVRVWMF